MGLVSAATSTSPGISLLLDDRYRVEEPIARGGMATVYRGHDQRLDRVVALSDAWQKGAKYWSRDKRKQIANDPMNLLAVDGPTNRGKGDGDAATWLPPDKAFRCPYVARQVAVKIAQRGKDFSSKFPTISVSKDT